MTYPSCGMEVVQFARQSHPAFHDRRTRAILVEPMQGTAGNIVPRRNFFRGEGSGRDADALLICDEMITGFGRTGRCSGPSTRTSSLT